MAHNNEIMPCDKCCNRKDAGCLGSTWLEESQCSRTWSYSGRRNIVGGWMVMKKLRFFQIISCVCSREWNPGLCVSVVRVIPAGSCPRGISTVTSSVSQFSHSGVSNFLQRHGLEHTRLPCPSTTPGACSNSCPSHQWCHPTISSSVIPFSSCPQSFPASGFFPRSQFFASGAQSVGVSASAIVLLTNIQDWFPLGWTGCISLQSKGLSRVFSNNTVQKHQFFGAQLSL